MAKGAFIPGKLFLFLLWFFMVCDQLPVVGLVREGVGDGVTGRRRDDLAPQRQVIRGLYAAEVGVREVGGENRGRRIGEYLTVTSLGEGYAWCAAFVSWVFARAGYVAPRSAWSPALFPKEKVIWQRGGVVRQDVPQAGDVFGIWFPSLGRIAHVGFVDHWGGTYVVTVEGNTNDPAIAAQDGVHRKRRLLRSIYQVADWLGDATKMKN